MKAGDIDLLKRIAEFEDSADATHIERYGWTWREVKIWAATLNRLVVEGYLDVVFRTNSRTGYRLTGEGRALAEDHQFETEPHAKAETLFLPNNLPEDLFGDIIGHREIKELLRAVILAPRTVHVLLAGPPALAKSLFLWDLEKMLGNHALWVLGTASSKAGLQEMLLQKRPYLLLIDELDKLDGRDQGALMSVMEGGRVTRTKVGRMADEVIKCRVVATANEVKRLAPELISRFAVRRIGAYTSEEFKGVVIGVLQRREGLEESLAVEVADRLEGRTQDVRDAIRVARLSSQLGVEKAVKLLLE